MLNVSIRFATFNASLNRNSEGQLIADLSTPNNAQAKAVAEIIQRVNPDVLLINEFDYFSNNPLEPVNLFRDNYLEVSQNGAQPVTYNYAYIAPSNTGIASGFDLNNNGSVVTTPGAPGYGDDAFGFGNFPGQFGMVLFSKYPIDTANIRTFQNFLWKDMPDALLPDNSNTPAPQDWYSPEELAVFRLSSKSHWDVPIQVNGETIHALVSHPTPPVFDGPEDRNGKRNHDEIRLWADYITPGEGDYIYDDAGNFGGLTAGAKFVIMGDQNADPFDGDSVEGAILQLLDNSQVNVSVTPTSGGGPQQAALQGGANATHQGNPAFDTADFADGNPGNIRADYVLPSNNLQIVDAAVFWPLNDDPLFPLVGTFDPNLPGGFPSSDHRLVWVDATVPTRQTVTGVGFLGLITFPTDTEFGGTQVGGLSGITYDAGQNFYYSISDDRSQNNPARFYTLTVNLSDGTLDDGDVNFTGMTTLLDGSGNPFPALSLDPEGIALTRDGNLYISSEGDANALISPFINQFSLEGEQLSELPIADKYLPTADKSSGIRNNLAFESAAISPDGRYLYSATEEALNQDGPRASLTGGSLSRILKYDLTTGELVGEFVYEVEKVTDEPIPPDSSSNNGLVELLALDNNGTLLALERSFSTGVGNTVKLFEIRTQGALDVQGEPALAVAGTPYAIDPPVSKRELLDFAVLGITPDNLEGMSLGQVLPDGRQSLIVVSDNNFSATQTTQVIALALDLQSIPVVLPKVETPQVIDTDEEIPEGAIAGDADDPAIWLHPTDSAQSLVITSLKDGGLAVFDLEGTLLQSILPADYGDIRYNNIDLVYGFQLGTEKADLAVASDRENDTLAIYQIDPVTRQLADITSSSIPASIFGIDDGSQTAYGLAAYTSPISGKHYVFVSQREGNQIAQLELLDDGTSKVTAVSVRTLTVPIPEGGELADAQVEGMVADRELGYLYAGQEQVGIWKFVAEPDGSSDGVLIDSVEGENLEPDVEGLTIYYADEGTGYLLASSQGDSSFAVYQREGDNEYLGNFAIGAAGAIDSTEESDGADVLNVPLGSDYPFGLLVVQDGANDPQVVVEDDGELENSSANFKYVPWQDVSQAFPEPLQIAPTTFNPRNPTPTTLPNGAASGDTTQTSTVLWTRSTVLGDVTFEYSASPDFGAIAGTLTTTVTDALQPVKVEITDLTPGTDYYYRATDAAGVKLGGQFKTADALGNSEGLRFGVSGDWRGELAPYPAIANAIDRNLEFFVLHGDTIYADYESPILPGVEQATSLEEYRLKHAEVYGSRNNENFWAQLRSQTSVLATIDDHEVTDDFAGGAPISSDPRFTEAFPGDDPTDLINDSTLYENGLQAFQEYNPLRDEFYGETGDERTAGERQLYRYNTYGNDATTFVLDTRSFRDRGLPGVTDPSDPNQVAAYLAASFDPTRTLLGEQQLEDLKQDLLKASEAGITWKFVMVPEPIQNLGVVGASDRFEGYAAERTEILKFIDDNDINNVVFVTADIHGTVVNNLTYQTAAFAPQIATNAWEISTGSVAFDAPFGPTVIDLAIEAGLLNPAQEEFYESLPVANDADSLPNDKDDFIKQLVNDSVTPLGYDPVGLNDNLPVADGLIDATLLQGDYLATHTYGWTEFDIDPLTQILTVTTYGIAPYSEAELLADPTAIIDRVPTVVSQFTVSPQGFTEPINGTDGGETLNGTPGDDRINGLGGNDTIAGQQGNDLIFGGGGDDVLRGDANSRSPGGTVGGDDIIYGGEGNDRIGGKAGNDQLFGDVGDDQIWGDDGDDLLRGGLGNDTLTGDDFSGGQGSDTFVLAVGEGTDTIVDFEDGTDFIGLADGLTFADLVLMGNTIKVGSETLATLNINTGVLTEADFALF